MSKLHDWIRGGSHPAKAESKAERKGPRVKAPTLDDVTPLHPDEYPAKHMKERLDARRDMLEEIVTKSHAGIPEGHGPEV